MHWTQNLAPIVSANIRRLRQSHGLTRRQLADKTGLHLNTLGKIERDAANASLDTLDHIAVALDTTIDRLLEDHTRHAQHPTPARQQHQMAP